MRTVKLVSLGLSMVLVLVFSFTLVASAKAPASSSQTYTVMVGMENPHRGVEVMAYFPYSVTIHVGDTIHWVQNSNEIHTVTFLDGAEPPPLIITAEELGVPSTPSPLLFNPAAVNPAVPTDGRYDGTGFVNSGLMGREAGQFREFTLTFTEEGTYDYMCLVHGFAMSGEIVVVGQGEHLSSPNQSMAQGREEMAEQLAKVPAVVREANKSIEPPIMNDDGGMTHRVMIGYADGQIELMQFFPDRLVVRPGDTVVWEMSAHNNAPHTVTFLNGAAEPDLVIAVPQSSGPPLLYANPATFFPYPDYPPTLVLTRDGIYNSGVMNPIPGTSYTLSIGDMTPGLEPFVCLLHNESGMKGTLIVVPAEGNTEMLQ
jgi:plastocyanin